jgi:hypothetical protein
LMKQVAIAIVLSVLLYCYSLIMGTSDAVLPWALKILMITLVTIAVFIYRKPFQHLFSAVGYGTIGSQERAEYSLREAGATFRRSTVDAATVAIPGVAGYRAARWARRNPAAAAATAAAVAGGAGAAAGAAASAASGDTAAAAGAGQATGGEAHAARLRPDIPPVADGDGDVSSGSSTTAVPSRGSLAGSSAPAGPTGSARSRNLAEADGGGRTAPPLDLPPRSAANGSAANGSAPHRGTANGSAPHRGTSNGSPSRGGASNGSAFNGSSSHRGASNGAGPSSAASGWSRGSGRSSAGFAGLVSPRSRGASPGPVGSSRSPGSSGAPSSGSSGSGGSNGSNGSGGSGSWPASPAWSSKSSAGWPGVGARQRPGARPRPSAPPSRPAAADGGPANGADPDEPRAMPFWLRPIRRDK